MVAGIQATRRDDLGLAIQQLSELIQLRAMIKAWVSVLAAAVAATADDDYLLGWSRLCGAVFLLRCATFYPVFRS